MLTYSDADGGDQIIQACISIADLKTDKFISYKIRFLDPCYIQVKKTLLLNLYLFLYHKWHIQTKPSIVNSHQWLRNEALHYGCDLSLFLPFIEKKKHLLLTFLFEKCKW